jgi:hypothetical protein
LIAELVRLEVTTAGKAKRVGVHPKTVAKFFLTIRERRAAECKAGLDKLKVESIVYSDG